MNKDELASLKVKINFLQKMYGVLFIGSLVMLALIWFVLGRTAISYSLWIVLLGGAVLVRLYRTSLVNKYNQSTTGQIQ